MYLGDCAEAANGVVSDGHFKIDRPLEEDELKIKRRTRGRPAKVITSCTSKDKTHKLPKNQTGGILMAVHRSSGEVLDFHELLNGENAAAKIELLSEVTKALPPRCLPP